MVRSVKRPNVCVNISAHIQVSYDTRRDPVMVGGVTIAVLTTAYALVTVARLMTMIMTRMNMQTRHTH